MCGVYSYSQCRSVVCAVVKDVESDFSDADITESDQSAGVLLLPKQSDHQ